MSEVLLENNNILSTIQQTLPYMESKYLSSFSKSWPLTLPCAIQIRFPSSRPVSSKIGFDISPYTLRTIHRDSVSLVECVVVKYTVQQHFFYNHIFKINKQFAKRPQQGEWDGVHVECLGETRNIDFVLKTCREGATCKLIKTWGDNIKKKFISMFCLLLG